MAASLVITGSTADAEAAVARLERRFDALENKIAQAGKKSKDSGDAWDSSIGGIAAKYVTITAVIGSVGTALKAVGDENTKLLNQLDEFAARNSQTTLKLQIQGAMTSPEVRAMMPGLEKSLMATPSANMDNALKIQTQLASSGFKGEDVKSGEALKAMLDIKAATNQFGESIGDEAEAAKSLSMLLKAGGSANPSAKEMRNLGGSIVSLFESSDVQFPDFKQLAPKISGLKNFGLSMEESVATFSALTDVMGGNKADTGLAQFVSRTATAGAFPERAAELKKLGLSPEDVAMAPGGKSITETIDLMRTRMKALPQAEQNQIVAKLYGEEAGPSASYLMSDAGSEKMKEYIGKASNRVPFERNVSAFQESRYAANARMGISKDFALANIDIATGGKSWAEYNAESEADALQQNIGQKPGRRMLNNFGTVVERAATSVPYYLGMTPTEAGVGGSEVNSRVRQQSEGNGGDIQKLIEIQAEALKVAREQKQRPLNLNPGE